MRYFDLLENEAAWKYNYELRSLFKELNKTYSVLGSFRTVGDEPMIELLVLHSTHRGNGNATMFMKKLCEKADELSLWIKLEPEQMRPLDRDVGDKPTPTTQKLTDWYQKFGFVKTGEMNHGREVMIRTPNHKGDW